MDVVPLDVAREGSHGRPTADPDDGPLLNLFSQAMNLKSQIAHADASEVKDDSGARVRLNI
jgi:hypothetical protein